MYNSFLLVAVLTVLIFGGCSSRSIAGKFTHSVLQSKGAEDLRELQYDMDALNEKYRVMINEKNPHSYSKQLSGQIRFNILHIKDNIKLKLKNTNSKYAQYIQYFQMAFNKEEVENRNDYLILGIHKMLFYAYNRDKLHKLSALEYDVEKLKEVHKALQVLKWSIRNLRDKNGDFLFITWQNQWQIELEKRLKNGEKFSTQMLLSIKSIKNGSETLLQPSDMRFEEVLSNMILIVDESIGTLGGEPVELGTNAIKNLVSLIIL